MRNDRLPQMSISNLKMLAEDGPLIFEEVYRLKMRITFFLTILTELLMILLMTEMLLNFRKLLFLFVVKKLFFPFSIKCDLPLFPS